MASIVTLHALISLVFALSFFLVFFSTFPLTIATSAGFTVDIVHRDSPKSPFYNTSESPSQRTANALRRSFNRANHFKSVLMSQKTPVTNIISANGAYVMNISIGTPRFGTVAIADTGSDLIWTQCKPCTSCFNQTVPLFNPESSSTYKTVSCSSDTCQSISGAEASCSNTSQDICQYSASYGDQSFSNGDLAVDTLTLGSTSGSPLSFPNTVFGCGHNNEGTFNGEESGIVGLGGGSSSLISQLDSSIDGKFSYCLVPSTSESESTSKMNFGSNGVVSGDGVVSTPLGSGSSDTFYYLTLEGISVGDERLDFNSSSSSGGNIIIDSGTTLTYLLQDFYSSLESAVAKKIDAEPVSDPSQILSLCYKSDTDINVPEITVHFSGADVKLNPLNTFIVTSQDTMCFAFAGSSGISIYGNVAQMNFLVGYDRSAQTVSFKPTDCTKQ